MPVPAEILYEDNHLLVVSKPANMPTQPDASGDPDLLNGLKAYLKDKYDKPGNVFLGLVHRLDRPTSGVMVFARTSKAASRLSDQLRRRQIRKEYLAVVHGVPPETGELQHHLVKNRDINRVHTARPGEDRAKPALLHYQRLQTAGRLSLIYVRILTGRSHQIRVQLAASGYPLWGDHKYNEHPVPASTLALHASRLQLIHPTLGTPISFRSWPADTDPWHRFGWLGKARVDPTITDPSTPRES